MDSFLKTKLIIKSEDLNSGSDYEGNIKMQNIDEGYYRLLETDTSFFFTYSYYNSIINNFYLMFYMLGLFQV